MDSLGHICVASFPRKSEDCGNTLPHYKKTCTWCTLSFVKKSAKNELNFLQLSGKDFPAGLICLKPRNKKPTLPCAWRCKVGRQIWLSEAYVERKFKNYLFLYICCTCTEHECGVPCANRSSTSAENSFHKCAHREVWKKQSVKEEKFYRKPTIKVTKIEETSVKIHKWTRNNLPL